MHEPTRDQAVRRGSGGPLKKGGGLSAPTSDLHDAVTRTANVHVRTVSGRGRHAGKRAGRDGRSQSGARAQGSALAEGPDPVPAGHGIARQAPPADGPPGDSALDALNRIAAMIRGRQVAVFLDYDGTLAPIVARPGEATMSEGTRAVLATLARRCPVAIISGRRRTDVARLVGLDTIAYAGSHGFDIQSANLGHIEHPQVRAFVPDIKAAVQALERRLGAIPGVIIEDKIFVLALHYRLVGPADMAAVAAAVEHVAREHPRLRRTEGKQVHELRPQLDWDKGKAVLWLLETLPLDRHRVVPLYIGDDETDEDAFAALAGRGIGILVADRPRATSAHLRLRNPEEVGLFLDRLGRLLAGGAE